MTRSSSSPSSRTDPAAVGNHNYTLAASRRGVLPADMELATTVVAVVPDNTALEDAPLDVGLAPVVSTPVLLARHLALHVLQAELHRQAARLAPAVVVDGILLRSTICVLAQQSLQ